MENPTPSVSITSASGALSGSRPRFPSGNQAEQERYIEAFRGLTQLIASANANQSSAGGTYPLQGFDTWEEMFRELVGTHEDEEKPDAE